MVSVNIKTSEFPLTGEETEARGLLSYPGKESEQKVLVDVLKKVVPEGGLPEAVDISFSNDLTSANSADGTSDAV